jgi:hypothetical protein
VIGIKIGSFSKAFTGTLVVEFMGLITLESTYLPQIILLIIGFYFLKNWNWIPWEFGRVDGCCW